MAPQLTPEQLEAETRARREQLDYAHVRDEEQRIQDARSLKLYKRRDGSSRLIADLDREATVVVSELLDNATGPRRSGPRFCLERGQDVSAGGVQDDPRSTEQLAHDVLFTVLRLGLDANPSKLPGRRPAVRIVVTERDLKNWTGYAELEGKGQTVSLESVDRHICDTGVVEISVVNEQGKPLNHGTEKRAVHRGTTHRAGDPGWRMLDELVCDTPASMGGSASHTARGPPWAH